MTIIPSRTCAIKGMPVTSFILIGRVVLKIELNMKIL